MSDPDTLQTDGAPFEHAAQRAMESLGGALSSLLAALPGPIDRAVDVERALNLDKKLAWQVYRLARQPSPTEVAKVPAPRSVRRLLAAAKRLRIPADLTDKVRLAFEQFEAFAAEHAGDREALTSMVRGLSPAANEQEELRLRRAIFRGNAHVWGLRMRQFVRSTIFLPPDGPPGAARGEIMLSAHIGLEQTRPDSHAAIISWARPSSRASAEGPASPAGPNFTLHREFCSLPLPQMLQRASVGSGIETELVLPGVGKPGATTLYTSQSLGDVRTTDLPRFETNNIFCIPVETVVFDVMVPAELSTPDSARAAFYGRRYHPEHVFERRDADLLPQPAALIHLGRFTGPVPDIAGAPRHPEAVTKVLTDAGHATAPFDLYRCTTRYPVLHTLLALGITRAAT